MAAESSNDWSRSAAAVVIKDGKVLLTRHTYGSGKGLLIIPGGYLHQGEPPEQAVVREVMEETGVTVEPVGLAAARFNSKDWYMVFLARYLEGEPRSDGDENSEVLWLPLNEAVSHPDVPELTRRILEGVFKGGANPLMPAAYQSSDPAASLYVW